MVISFITFLAIHPISSHLATYLYDFEIQKILFPLTSKSVEDSNVVLVFLDIGNLYISS